jgi:hypothetical protein
MQQVNKTLIPSDIVVDVDGNEVVDLVDGVELRV